MRSTWLVLLALSLAACGGRSLPNDRDGGVRDGAVADGYQFDALRDGPYPKPDGGVMGCTSDDQCVIAVRTDNCCQAAYPELITTVAQDPCLELWSASGPVSSLSECLAQWDPQCAYVDCMPAPPQSRVARCDQGSCTYALECVDPTDCTLATNVRECCPCPVAVPAALLDVDACLVRYPGGGAPPPSCYPGACPAMPCQTCQVPTANCLQQTCEGLVPE
jgi:hypothetical protein